MRNRGGGRRRRIPFFLLLATTALVLILWHNLSEPTTPAPVPPPKRRTPAAAKRLREKLSLRGRTRRKGGATTVASAEAPFDLPKHLLPVHHDASLMIYSNTPVASTRPPSNQFLLDPRADLSEPIVAIITATNNPRPVLLETATTLFGQSLQNFVWIIVNDHTEEPSAFEVLEQVSRDPRVVVIQNRGAQGLAAGRNVGLEHVFRQYSPPPKYLVSLDDDDLFEYTALEKACWMLESNPDWDLGGFRYVKWGASNETVTTGLHANSDNFLVGNFVPNAAVYTSRAVLGSGCRYDEVEFQGGGEDWDFWMCLAEHGYWGGSLLEPLYWCALPRPSFRLSLTIYVQVPRQLAQVPLAAMGQDFRRRLRRTQAAHPDEARSPRRQLPSQEASTQRAARTRIVVPAVRAGPRAHGQADPLRHTVALDGRSRHRCALANSSSSLV